MALMETSRADRPTLGRSSFGNLNLLLRTWEPFMAELTEKRIFWGSAKPKAVRDYMLKPEVSNFSRVISQYKGRDQGKLLHLHAKNSDGAVEETFLGFSEERYKVEGALNDSLSPRGALLFWVQEDDDAPVRMQTMYCFLEKPVHIAEGRRPCAAALIVPEIRKFISAAGPRWLGHFDATPRDSKDLRQLIRTSIARNAGWSPPPETDDDDEDEAAVSPAPPGMVAFNHTGSTYPGYLFTIVNSRLRYRSVRLEGSEYYVVGGQRGSLVETVIPMLTGESKKRRLRLWQRGRGEDREQAKKPKLFPQDEQRQ